MSCKCCHHECETPTTNNGVIDASEIESTFNETMTLEEVKTALYLRYGIGIELRSLDEVNDIYYLDRRYVFFRTDLFYKHTKEFTMKLSDMLYRNYYWINSPYKMEALYDNVKKNIVAKGYVKNKELFIPITMDDGRTVKFYPDYVNEKTLWCMHYFDQSWFSKPDLESGNEYVKKIFDFFEREEDWTLEFYFEEHYERDFD